MTRYERYMSGETDLVQVDFVRSLFAAYQDADEPDKTTLAEAFPEYFQEDNEEKRVYDYMEKVNSLIDNDPVLTQLRKGVKAQSIWIVKSFIENRVHPRYRDAFITFYSEDLAAALSDEGLRDTDEAILEFLEEYKSDPQQS